MPTFNNLNDLFKHLQKKVTDTMNDEVAYIVKFEEQRQIEDSVYSVYPQPYVYERRRFNDGGLQDIEMMVSTVSIQGNNVVLSVVNEARGKDQEDLYLAPLVEYGDNTGHGEYQYKYNRDMTSWQYLQSRPFTSNTIEALRRSGAHIKAFKDGMRSRGIRIE